VQTPPPGAAHPLWQALERNAEWIRRYISVPASVLKEYLKWSFERLIGRVPPNASEQELDHLVRSETKRIYSKFRDRPTGVAYFGDYEDPAGDRFREAMEVTDEARECLEQVPGHVRKFLEDVYSMDEEEFSRDELARRLGIKRNTLDQRICRAMKAIRLRVKR
jgi:hypothetical protein